MQKEQSLLGRQWSPCPQQQIPSRDSAEFHPGEKKTSEGKASAGSLGDPVFSSSSSVEEMPREEGKMRLLPHAPESPVWGLPKPARDLCLGLLPWEGVKPPLEVIMPNSALEL